VNLPFFKKRTITPDLYTHYPGENFTNGAEEFAFVQRFQNPMYLITGTGYQPRRTINPLSAPQVYANQQAMVNGLGGIQTGQLFFAPLTDSNYNQVE
jgi:hypothetical protein